MDNITKFYPNSSLPSVTVVNHYFVTNTTCFVIMEDKYRKADINLEFIHRNFPLLYLYFFHCIVHSLYLRELLALSSESIQRSCIVLLSSCIFHTYNSGYIIWYQFIKILLILTLRKHLLYFNLYSSYIFEERSYTYKIM